MQLHDHSIMRIFFLTEQYDIAFWKAVTQDAHHLQKWGSPTLKGATPPGAACERPYLGGSHRERNIKLSQVVASHSSWMMFRLAVAAKLREKR
jgi:hypothetical protein